MGHKKMILRAGVFIILTLYPQSFVYVNISSTFSSVPVHFISPHDLNGYNETKRSV